MGLRRQAREWALQFLFQRDVNRGPLDPALELFWADKTGPQRARAYAETLIRGVEHHRRELDQLISRYAEHWDVKRMGGVDRNVMRIGLYEMTGDQPVPPLVAIDEAVEIAKQYSSNESGRFVNGILDRARQDVCPPPKEVAS